VAIARSLGSLPHALLLSPIKAPPKPPRPRRPCRLYPASGWRTY
jgi:hypothetical protein